MAAKPRCWREVGGVAGRLEPAACSPHSGQRSSQHRCTHPAWPGRPAKETTLRADTRGFREEKTCPSLAAKQTNTPCKPPAQATALSR